MSKPITIEVDAREFGIILDAVADVVDECQQMESCGDEWPHRLELSSRLLDRLTKIEQTVVYPH